MGQPSLDAAVTTAASASKENFLSALFEGPLPVVFQREPPSIKLAKVCERIFDLIMTPIPPGDARHSLFYFRIDSTPDDSCG